jgi:hypothetical protein
MAVQYPLSCRLTVREQARWVLAGADSTRGKRGVGPHHNSGISPNTLKRGARLKIRAAAEERPT